MATARSAVPPEERSERTRLEAENTALGPDVAPVDRLLYLDTHPEAVAVAEALAAIPDLPVLMLAIRPSSLDVARSRARPARTRRGSITRRVRVSAEPDAGLREQPAGHDVGAWTYVVEAVGS